MCTLSSRFIRNTIKLVPHLRIVTSTGACGMAFQRWQISVKADKTRKESRGRARVKESSRKSKEMMPSGNLPNNSNVWQTTEPVKLENKGTGK